MELKNEFTFNFKGSTIKAKQIDSKWYAIGKPKNKEIRVFAYDEKETHLGVIETKEGVFLSWLPRTAFEGSEDKRETGANLIKKHNLPKYCEICFSTTRLEVHHVQEWKDTKNDNRDNLRVLCGSCHTIVHSIRAIKRNAKKQ